MVDGSLPKPADLTTTDGKKWVKNNWEALSIILTSLSDDLVSQVDPMGTAREAWLKLDSVYSKVSEANIDFTLMKLFSYKMGKDESPVHTYTLLLNLARDLKRMGMAILDRQVVAKITGSLPNMPKYDMFRTAWNNVDTANKTMENLLVRLKELELQDEEKKTDVTVSKAYHGKQKNGKPPHKSKKDREELMKRTKCHKCGKVGRWRSNGPDGDDNKKDTERKPEKQKQEAPGLVIATAHMARCKTKSGAFLSEREKKAFCALKNLDSDWSNHG